ncbi:uncharacterized protein LOC128990589 isoform X1 [Macrosteles quadrilineatus]|uniref:uncharacterized protein LOC128990589 isoform X1 n=1 Tax=Macrosteles quadrilineatus TaxID=74068 RepID=UPI0023E17045|nr:uncharacterized protein LOC128990589 isoform X1 [Macrosteles quadrilineatus]
MTSICKCITCCCVKWAQFCRCVFHYYFFNLFGFAFFSCCCYLLGMAAMLLILYLYYSTVYPGASLPDTLPVYDYGQDYSMYKREAEYPTEGYNGNVEGEEYYGEAKLLDNYEIARNKRENKTTPLPLTSTSTTDSKTVNTTILNNTTKTTPNVTDSQKENTTQKVAVDQEPKEEELDFKLSNSFVDYIQAEAERNNMKASLGLCRRVQNISTPQLNLTLFPVEQAQEIISCINDILKKQTKKHLCIELNPEMTAFLEWLILTGESKERRKQIKIKSYHDDFLFPSTCGSMQYLEVLSRPPMAPPDHVSPGPGGPPPAAYSVAGGGKPPTEEILTTCGPVLASGKSDAKTKKTDKN